MPFHTRCRLTPVGGAWALSAGKMGAGKLYGCSTLRVRERERSMARDGRVQADKPEGYIKRQKELKHQRELNRLILASMSVERLT